jgi:hypothetical protein
MMVLLAVHLSSPELLDAASGERLMEGLVVAANEQSGAGLQSRGRRL